MPYLFESQIAAGLSKYPGKADIRHLQQQAQNNTATLLQNHSRAPGNNYGADDATAQQLVTYMGAKVRSGRPAAPAGIQGTPHAQDSDYVGDAWRQVSDKCGEMRGKVLSELTDAYNMGLDIRDPFVIGRMYYFAVQVFSVIDDYSGHAQDEGER